MLVVLKKIRDTEAGGISERKLLKRRLLSVNFYSNGYLNPTGNYYYTYIKVEYYSNLLEITGLLRHNPYFSILWQIQLLPQRPRSTNIR